MLDLRPNCEYCDRDLPPASERAMICSYECTFCADCVQQVLHNVCPNCGGGFERRPIRPARQWRDGVSRSRQPPAEDRIHRPLDPAAHEAFAEPIRALEPARR